MRISKLLGATMVAGAIATGGAAAGIAGASASVDGSTDSATPSGTNGSEAPVASTSTTPASPSQPGKQTAPKARSRSGHNCPNMGSSSGHAGRPGTGAGSSYPEPAPRTTAQ